MPETVEQVWRTEHVEWMRSEWWRIYTLYREALERGDDWSAAYSAGMLDAYRAALVKFGESPE